MFTKYNSIENSYREEFLQKIKDQGFDLREYVVQEKVHGANLSFITQDGTQFYAAKRLGAIEPDEQFYNYQQVRESILPQLQELWKLVLQDFPSTKQMSVFGELCGGAYPHPEVSQDKNALVVQQGIYYSPANEFYAFDILLDKGQYLPVLQATRYFQHLGLLHAETLFKGSLKECLAYPDSFSSLIPKTLGLPTLEPNIAEGVVIKPIEACYLSSGSRVILKNKNDKWAENARYHKLLDPTENPSDKLRQLQETLQTYVTGNRLHNLLSKIGPVTTKDFGKVLGLYNKDILEDFGKDYHKELAEIDKKEVKVLNKSIGEVASEKVKTVLNP